MALGIKPELLLEEENVATKDFTAGDYAKDILAAPFRGVEGAAQSIYNLVDYATLDYLPDYNNRFLGKSETIAGSLVEGVTQFLVPYGGIAKGANAAAKLGRFGKAFSSVNAKGQQALNWKGILAAETATDFIAFDAQEERLSNLIQSFPSLGNPLTEYLAADSNDSELEGRFKNSLEGLGLTGLAAGLITSVKALKMNRIGEDGASYLRENVSAYQKRSFSEVDSYNAYSPAIRTLDEISLTEIPLEKIAEKMVQAGGGIRGVGEEIKWMGLDNPEYVREIVDPSEIVNGKITKKGLRQAVERSKLSLSIVEQEPKQLYRDLATQKGGENYREFTVDINPRKGFENDPALEAVRKQKEGMKAEDKLTDATSSNKLYDPHYDTKAARGGRENLAHFRTTTRFDEDGIETLYIEELQSDYLQSLGKTRQYEKKTGKKVLEDTTSPLEKSYVDSLMRAVTQMAAAEGYKRISWAKGQQITDLYEQKVDRLKIKEINEDGSKVVEITRKGNTTTQAVKNKEELMQLIGTKAADTVDSWEVGHIENNYTVTVKGTPFIQQYDERMPKAINRFAEQFGTKTSVKMVDRKTASVDIKTPEDFTKTVKSGEAGQAEDSFANMLTSLDTFPDTVEITRKGTNKPIDAREALREAMESNLPDNVDMNFNVDDVYELANQFDEYRWMESDPRTAEVFDTLYRRFNVKTASVKKAPLESHSLDISEEMIASMSKGVSQWGVRTKSMDVLGDQIKDPELRTAMGLDEVAGYSKLDVLAIEADARDSGDLLIPATDANTTIGFSLERLAPNGSSPEVRKLAESLKTLIGDNNEILDMNIQAYFNNEAAGAFNPVTSQIELYTNRTKLEGGGDPRQVFGEGTLLHEIVHATVVTKIPPQLSASNIDLKGSNYLGKIDEYIADSTTDVHVKGILSAYRTALDNIPKELANIKNHFNDPDAYIKKYGDKDLDKWYGLTNIDEFISESLSNPTFQTFLKGIPSENNKSLWDTLLDSLKQFLGIDAKGTLLEDTVVAYSDLITKNRKRYGASDYIPESQRRMFPTRSGREFFKRTQDNKAENLKTLVQDIEIDTSNIKRGGSIALSGVRNSLNQVETTSDLGELLAAAEIKLEAELRADPSLNPAALEKGGIVAAVQRFSEMTGMDKSMIQSEVDAAGKDANELRRIAARMYVVESLAADQADNVYKAAENIRKKGTGVTDVDKAQLVGSLKKMLHLNAAGSNLRRGFGQGLQSTQFKRVKLSLSDIEVRSQEILNEFMANNTTGNFDVLVNRILLSGDPEDVMRNTLGIAKTARQADPSGFMEKAQNWYVNSLLSGPRTMVKNGVGNFIAQSLLQVELAVGGVFVNPAITRQALKEMATLESFREGMNFFLKAYKLDDQLLDVGRSPLENAAKTERPQYFENAAPEQMIRQSFNWIGDNLVNIPTKLLLSMDEVFKQSMFRQNAKLEFTLKGMKLGIKDPDQLAQYVADGLDAVLVNGERAFSNAGIIKHAQETVKQMDDANIAAGNARMLPSERGAKVQEIVDAETAKRGEKLKSIEEGGLGLENLQELDNIAARSLEQARYGTFTNDAGKAAELAQAVVQTVPFLKFIFPFVRTPINILKFSFDRAFFAAPEMARNVMARMPDMPMLKQTQERMRAELESRDPIAKARAIGKLGTSVMINSSLLYMIMSNRDLLTGGGPKDVAEMKTLEQTGWQRYSFRIGNKYASFSGLDPIGTHFGVLVDLVEQLEQGGELNTSIGEQVFAAATVSMTRNLTDKSYLAGLQLLSDALSDPENKMEKMINNLAGGFVPNILYQGQSLGGDTTTREVRNISDAIMKKLPMGNDRLDPKRNILGEPIIQEQFKYIGPFNPSAMSTRDGDVVFEELAKLEHGFSNPNTKLDRMIDLDEYVNAKGQTAHDRRLQLMGETKVRGRTMRQELEKLINSGKYQRLSTYSEGGFKSPRVDLINKVMAKYRSTALNQMMNEFPEIREQYQNIHRAKTLAKRGAGEDALSGLLQQ
jgi:hypothetical protein